MSNAKLRLPNLRAVQIEDISDKDTNLVSFLDDCTPAQLELLRFNYPPYSPKATEAKFYMRSLPNIVNATTEEVYLYRLEFSEVELEQIVRASCNAETLLFEECNIHCSTALDFGSFLKYKTKALSFQCWVYVFDSNWKTDRSSSSTCFDNIIDAISKSGLRVSLQTISIDKNQILSAKKMQQMLNEKGMPHITVEEICLWI